jgi:hypothetical protein
MGTKIPLFARRLAKELRARNLQCPGGLWRRRGSSACIGDVTGQDLMTAVEARSPGSRAHTQAEDCVKEYTAAGL